MKKSKWWISFLICLMVVTAMFGQNKNMSQLGRLQYTSSTLHGDLNDVWGYVDSLDNEYAIVGLEKGVSIVDVTDPTNLTEVFYQSGPSTIWRDIKTWNKHAYITNESSGGMMIIDMSALPGTITSSDVYYHTGTNYPFAKAHNLFIDEYGIAYIFGSNYGNKGAIFLDLNNNPKVPVEVGVFDSLYLHDGMTRGDTLWCAAVFQGVFVVVDVSNKANPVVLTTQFTYDNFTHNCWISDDGNTLFTTDEVSSGFIGSYDVSNLSNVKNIDNIQSNPGSGVIVHNTHVFGNFLVTSFYKDGVQIVDATHPDNLVEVGKFDTSPFLQGPGFNGCWGVYPWLPSENIIATDMENGLYVLGADYIQGVYLKGQVKRFKDSLILPSAIIQSLNVMDTTIGGLDGKYSFAYADSGLYRFTFERTGYIRDTLDVFLQNGQLVIRDFYLRSETPFKIRGAVFSNSDQQPIANAQVLLESKYHKYVVQTDANGYFEVDSVFEDRYEITAGKWGSVNSCMDVSLIQSDSLTFFLDEGIYDDFTLDFGWISTANGTSGSWEREHLKETPGISTIDYPTKDEVADCSGYGMITGHSSKQNHDVDGGWNEILSPSFNANSINRPVVNISTWFRNDAPAGQDDTLLINLIQQADTINALKIHNFINGTQAQWVRQQFVLSDYFTDFSGIQLQVLIGDFGNDDLLEAGLDYFEVTEGFVGIRDISVNQSIQLYPNPVKKRIEFILSDGIELERYVIFDITGKEVQSGIISEKQGSILLNAVPLGLNLIQFTNARGEVFTERFVRK